MRLLVITQVMERSDPALGFFVRWVEEFAERAEHVEVICLRQGVNGIFGDKEVGASSGRSVTLLDGVRVYSLGKEDGRLFGMRFFNRIIYAMRFFRILMRIHGTYDTVFVHMNEEYMLLAGWYWRLCRTPAYLWRNHYKGSWRTRCAVAFSTKTFCTSRYSYTARFKKTVLMPVGVDVESLREDITIDRTDHSILFLARFDRSKKPHILVEALGLLYAKKIPFRATFAGGQSDSTSSYRSEVEKRAKELGIDTYCNFVGAVPNIETFRYYRSHDIFVNCSESGMLDKTIFKAAAAGCLVATSSLDIATYVDKRCIFADGNAEELAEALEYILAMSKEQKGVLRAQYFSLADQNTLSMLMERLFSGAGMGESALVKENSTN